MPTTVAQRAALDTTFWTSSWNGTDAALTGTALTWDFTQARYNGAKAVTSYKNGEYDTSYGMTTLMQDFLAPGSDGYDSTGKKILALTQGQRDSGGMIIAAMDYNNPVMPSGNVLAGKHMLDVAMHCALCAFDKTGIYFGTNMPTDTSVTAGNHAVTTVTIASPDYMGFPWLEYTNDGSQSQYLYTNRWHDVTFLDKEILHAFLLLSESPFWNQAPADGGPYSTYGNWVLAYLPKIFGVSDWLLFGGTSNYYTNLVPTAINANGYGSGGAIKIADDKQELGLTHRLACNTNLCLYSSLLAAKFATPSNGYAVKADYYLYFAKDYDQKRRAAQILVASTQAAMVAVVPQIAGFLPLGISGYHPENMAKDGQGYDVNYSTTTLFELEKTYCRWPDSTYADEYIKPELDLAAPPAASRVDPNTGNINLYWDSRVNPYIEMDSTQLGYNTVVGLPKINIGTTQVPVWLEAGESNNATNTANEKTPSYEIIPNALIWYGGIQLGLTGTDAAGDMLLGAKACNTKQYNYVAPVAPTTIRQVSAVPSSVEGGTALTASRVYLTNNAATNTTVLLVSSQPNIVSVPATVNVLAGRSSQTFNISTNTVTELQTITITATDNLGNVQETTIIVTPAPTPIVAPDAVATLPYRNSTSQIFPVSGTVIS